MKLSPENLFAVSLSVGLHVLLLALLWFGLPDLARSPAPTVIPVQAVFLDASRSQLSNQRQIEEARRQAEAEAKRKAEAAARAKREAEEAARRKAAEQAKREAAEREAQARRKAEEEVARKAAEAKRKAEEEAARKAAEAKRKAEEEAARKAAEAKRKAEEQARRQEEAERRLREALGAEEAAIEAQRQAAEQAKQDASDRDRYAARVRDHIRQRWARPPGADEEFVCTMRIAQLPGGQIQSYELLSSCGNPFLDASVEKAIRDSDPLPLPENPRVFERTLKLDFVPK